MPEWDGIICWPRGKRSQLVAVSCPEYVYDFDHRGLYILINQEALCNASVTVQLHRYNKHSSGTRWVSINLLKEKLSNIAKKHVHALTE